MNANAAEADDQPLPQELVTALAGTATYVPQHAPEGEVNWSWSRVGKLSRPDAVRIAADLAAGP